MAKNFNIKSKNLMNSLENGYSEPANPPVSNNSFNDVIYENLQVTLDYFTPDNAPESYQELKKEIKVLEKIHAQSFIILAHRLKIIRDKELYKEDGYFDFKAFVENELDITRRTVYRHISLLEVFGVTTLSHEGVKTSNLLLLIPFIEHYPKEKDNLIKLSNEMSNRKLKEFLVKNYPLKTLSLREEENEDLQEWYTSKEELIANSKFLRDGMKPKTIKSMIKELVNLAELEDPKNKTLEKMRKLLNTL